MLSSVRLGWDASQPPLWLSFSCLPSGLGKRSNLTVRIVFNLVEKFKHQTSFLFKTCISAGRGMVPKRALLQKSDFGPALSLATVLKT